VELKESLGFMGKSYYSSGKVILRMPVCEGRDEPRGALAQVERGVMLLFIIFSLFLQSIFKFFC
jgi:hypothetical protein